MINKRVGFIHEPSEDNYKAMKLDFDLLLNLYKNDCIEEDLPENVIHQDDTHFSSDIFGDQHGTSRNTMQKADTISPLKQRKRSRTHKNAVFSTLDDSKSHLENKNKEITHMNLRYERLKGEKIDPDQMSDILNANNSYHVSFHNF